MRYLLLFLLFIYLSILSVISSCEVNQIKNLILQFHEQYKYQGFAELLPWSLLLLDALKYFTLQFHFKFPRVILLSILDQISSWLLLGFHLIFLYELLKIHPAQFLLLFQYRLVLFLAHQVLELDDLLIMIRFMIRWMLKNFTFEFHFSNLQFNLVVFFCLFFHF